MKITQSNVNLASAAMHYESNIVDISTGVAIVERPQGSFKDDLELRQKEADEMGSENYNHLKPTKSSYPSGNGLTLEDQIMAIRTSLLEQILKYMQLLGGGSKSASYRQMLSGMSNLISSGSSFSVTTYTETHIEQEAVSFEGKGIALTEDGRSIDFNVSFSMSTVLARSAGISIAHPVNFIDPLVINVRDDVTSISDQKFYFDLDCNGEEEEIAAPAGGSGFLSLDINGDGKINDGAELFGAKSGDGFAELSAYDLDGNGWIDENDDVFDKLRVWLRNEDGTDTLLSLKEADVGAIYLRSAVTEYNMRDSSFNTAAKLRSSGIFLKESGGVGVVQQVDLAAR